MKTDELKSALSAVKDTFDRTTNEALKGIYVSVDNLGDGEMRSTNGYETVKTLFKANVATEGEALIDGYTLTNMVNTFEVGDITVKLKSSFGIDVTHPTGKLEILGMDPSNFPAFVEATEDSTFTAPIEDLVEILSKPQFARLKGSSGDLDAKLTGIGIIAEDGEVTIATTDRKRIARYLYDAPNANDINVVVPVEVIKGTKHLVGSVQVTLNSNKIQLKTSETTYQSVVVAQKFPSVGKYFPTGRDADVKFQVAPLSTVLKRVMILAKGSGKSYPADVTMRFTENEIALDYSSRAGKISEVLPIEYDGGDATMNINADVFLDGLKQIESASAEMVLLQNNRAVILRAKDEESFSYFMMAVV